MEFTPPFRPAVKADSRRIAELFSVASGGVADYVWSQLDYPGLSPIEIGEQRYAREDTDFSYQNCVVAEIDGEVAGMLVAFPMAEEQPDAGASEPSEIGAPASDEPDVLAPYSELEVPGSYYVCGIALLPECRNHGLGTRFLEIAREQARERGLRILSLLVFEQNEGAVRLYERHGYRVVDRRQVVPHPLIQYGGDVLLMTAEVRVRRRPG